MNEDLERVRKQLDYLVERAQEIEPLNLRWGLVKYLRLEGVKGIPGRARMCPIANYLRRETGLEVGISATAVAVDGCDGSLGVPPVISDFINRFDRGEMLDLEERNPFKLPSHKEYTAKFLDVYLGVLQVTWNQVDPWCLGRTQDSSP